MGKIFEALKKAGYENTHLFFKTDIGQQKNKTADSPLEMEESVGQRAARKKERKSDPHDKTPENIIEYKDAVADAVSISPISITKVKNRLSRATASLVSSVKNTWDKIAERIIEQFDIEEVESDLIALAQPSSIAADQFKILKTNILFPLKGKKPRLILVTSAVTGEGKSFVSANLSASIAQNVNEHVLLIDCDLRKPKIHTIYGLNNQYGLSDYLTNGNDISSILYLEEIKMVGGPMAANQISSHRENWDTPSVA